MSHGRWTMDYAQSSRKIRTNPCKGKQTARTLVELCKIFEMPITTYADNQSDNRKCYLRSPDVPSYDFESDLSLSQCQCLQCVVYKINRLINYIIIGLRHGVSVLMSVRILFLYFLFSSFLFFYQYTHIFRLRYNMLLFTNSIQMFRSCVRDRTLNQLIIKRSTVLK